MRYARIRLALIEGLAAILLIHAGISFLPSDLSKIEQSVAVGLICGGSCLIVFFMSGVLSARNAMIELNLCIGLASALAIYAGRLFLPSGLSLTEQSLAMGLLIGAAGLTAAFFYGVFSREK